ncbi:helix-turn-helix domain-containing protein [Methylobacterium aquaticum]|uniref:helix-turn-helix domain-containing protein n=1 Tax=Methylobacterium aquaticum TaxID=270351 RepID=UPI0019325B8B|nr:helix-turn-helix domain-containing protein [Methylobacterium aquaticum]QRE75251.1 helix-turn-helix domain-containing protein [Methylobacterium aquaticum]
MSGIPVDRFAPDLDPAAAWKAWTEHLAPIFDVRPVPETHAGPEIGMRSYNLGSILVGEVSAPAQMLERSGRMAARQGVDHVLIQLYRRGTGVVRTDRAEVEIGPSDFVIYDLAQPVAITSSAVTATNILVPRVVLGDRAAHIDSLHGSVFGTASDRVAQIFGSYLSEVVAHCGDLTIQRAAGLAQAAASLCATALPNPSGDAAVTERRIGLAVRTFIQDNLGSPDLGPEMICARFGLSRATLYRQFAADDGVQSYIRHCRLAQAMRLLTAPPDGGRPRISSVAYATGFSDERSFSRAFKRRYGCLPRDVAVRRVVEPLRSGAGHQLGEWVQRLGL